MKRIGLVMKYLCFALLGVLFLSTTKAQNADFKQAANGSLAHTDLGGVSWINGALNPENSTYSEGMSVPQLITLSEVPTANSHTLIFKHEVYRGSSNAFAYDFLTSWSQAQATTSPANTLDNLVHSSLTESATVTINDKGIQTVNGVDLTARKTAYGDRTFTIYGDKAITSSSLTLSNIQTIGGNSYAIYNLTWTSASTSIAIELAGHLAVTDAPNNGAGQINGAPYHFKLETLDGKSLGNRDNQILISSSDPTTCIPPAVFDNSLSACESTERSGTATFTLNNSSVTSDNSATVTWYSDVTLKTPVVFDENTTNQFTTGNTTVYADVSNGTCSDYAQVTITVNPLPTITLGSIPAVCFGATTASLSYSATGNTPTTYSLTFDATAHTDGFTDVVNMALPASPISITIPSTAKAGTTYNATVTVNNGTCTSASYPVTITINALPPCTITRTDVTPSTTQNPNQSTVGATATFSGPAGSYTYVWSFVNNTSGATFVGSNTSQTLSVKTGKTGSYTLTLTVTSTATGCVSAPSCTYAVNVAPIGPSITYTQGFYGNSGGKTCNTKYSYQVMNDALTAAGGMIRFGNPTDSRSFTLVQADVSKTASSNIYKMLPGGTTPNALKFASSFDATATTAIFANLKTYPALPMSSTGSINNILLAQTMALRFNIYYSNSVGKAIAGLKLTGNVLTFAKPTTSCGSTYQTTGTIQTIPCSVYNYLVLNGGATISNLLDLANKVLGGVVSTITPSDMTAAVDAINKGFDGGAQIIAVSLSSTCTTSSKPAPVAQEAPITKLGVSAYPNPFTNQVKFTVQSPVSGKGSLDIYNLLGQKIYSVYKGNVLAGRKETIEFNVPSKNSGNLIYSFKVGSQQVNGKLIQVK